MKARSRFTAAGRAGGFSLLEVLFAIAMLAVGIIGILALFTTGIKAAGWSRSTTTAAMEAQSLATLVMTEVEGRAAPGTPAKKVYLERIAAGKEWIHSNGSPDPILYDEYKELYWVCRALPVASDDTDGDGYPDPNGTTAPPMDPDRPFDKAGDYGGKGKPQGPMIKGLYQITIGVYKNWRDGKPPIATYTTFVTAGF